MRFKNDDDNRYRVNFTRATEAHIDKMTVAEFIEYLENNAEFEDESTPIYIDGKIIWCKDCILKETYKLRKEFLVSEDGSRLFYSISVIKRAELVDDSTEAAADNEREENKDMSTYTQFEKRLKEDIKAVKRARKVIGDDCVTSEGYTKYDALHILACDLALCNTIDELKKQVRADSNDLPRDVYEQMQQYIEQNVKEIEETEEPAKPWEEQERTVTLTNELCNMLQCYILMTTNHRKGEIEAWEKLAQETDENGTPKFKNAASNAQFWRDMEIQLQQIYTAAD
jgi:hypothetical protein